MENQQQDTGAPKEPSALSEAKIRAKTCAAEIDAALLKYNCFMEVEVTLTRFGITPKYKVVSNSNLVLPKG